MNPVVANPGTEKINNAKTFGHLLAEEMRQNPNFFLFSPDETTSNRLQEVYEVSARAWNLGQESWDLPESPNGQIIELLSENVLLATLLGHLSTGAPGMMTSYESFFSICYSQILQHLKFLRQLSAVSWQKPWPALNLLSTSMCWRQDHNGFTHQSPALISALLSVPGARVNCFFPVDDSASEATFRFMMSSQNVVNLATFDKNETPRWIDSSHANFLFQNGGASIYRFASDSVPEDLKEATPQKPESSPGLNPQKSNPQNPDVVLTALGDIATRELLRARELIKQDLPSARLRFVGLNSLTPGKIGTFDNPLRQETFDEYFTQDENIRILAAFHGYPDTLKSILANYTTASRLSVHGFQEQGTTTTPLEMLTMNHSSRFDFAAEIAETLGRSDLAEKYQTKIAENHEHALRYGTDLLEL